MRNLCAHKPNLIWSTLIDAHIARAIKELIWSTVIDAHINVDQYGLMWVNVDQCGSMWISLDQSGAQ